MRRSAALADALEVFHYLIAKTDELKGLLPRQIPYSVSSKLIGKEALLLAMFSFWTQQRGASWDTFFQHFELLKRAPEFRFYAPSCRWHESILQKFHGIFFKENLPFFSFQSLERTLVVENRESLLPLVGQCEKTLLVWGEGWKCIQLAQLCEMLPKPLFYWGDLDKEGVEIADKFCTQAFAEPLMMDEKTLNDHQHLIELVGESKSKSSQLILLEDTYRTVIQKKARIEQEKMVFDWKLLEAIK